MVNLLKLAWFAVVALFLTLLPGALWSGLLVANIKTGIAFPWAMAVMAAIIWIAWLYVGGKWGSARTSASRRQLLRANAVTPGTWLRALIANAFAIIALSGLWIVLRQLAPFRNHASPDFSKIPVLIVALILTSSALIGAISEESGIRGYLQDRLERNFSAPVAIVLAALVLLPGHGLSQGFLWPTVVFYFVVDIVYGTTARLTDSILPGIAAHTVGLLVFFALIWPYDVSRTLVTSASADKWFWIHVAQAAVFAALTIFSFINLGRFTAEAREQTRRALALTTPAATPTA
jgi:membrane protease YdiL (CAAX protease family)